MIRRLALTLALLLALPFAAAAQQPDDPIAAYRARIAELAQPVAAEVAVGAVRARLSRAFIETDIVFSRRYLDSWSVLLQDRWRQHVIFFETQDTALGNWEQAIAAGLATVEEAEAALDPAMERIRIMAETMALWQEDDTARLAERAFWTDLAHEIGCCDPLYYHALDEAEAAWTAALSPEPAAIAALELVPMVPTEAVEAVAPELRAYAWLASRAEALAEGGEDDPGMRRALLSEARMLESLFGLPAGISLDRSLATLAAREDYAARPVAPLLRLAAITEPGYLRDTLLERAAQRLQDRATHLGVAPAGAGSEEDGLTRSMAGDPVAAEAEAEDAPAAQVLAEVTGALDSPSRESHSSTAAAGGSAAFSPSPAPVAPLAPEAIAPPAAPPPPLPASVRPAPPRPSPEQLADARAAEAVGAALAALTGDVLDIATLAEIAGLAEEADTILQTEGALVILQSLAEDPVSDATR
jgi:hypothetical protein